MVDYNKNLPLDYWCNKTFEVIGAHFGGLENIAVETINFINVSEANIQVKENVWFQFDNH